MNLRIDKDNFDKFLDNAHDMVDQDLLWEIGNEIVNYSKDSIRRESWGTKQWPPPKERDGKMLIDSGKLWNSIEIKEVNDEMVSVGSDVEYADIHNSGGKIKVTSKMKKYFWRKFNSTGNSRWKAMALSNEIVIPQRQFLGMNDELESKIENIIKEKWDEL